MNALLVAVGLASAPIQLHPAPRAAPHGPVHVETEAPPRPTAPAAGADAAASPERSEGDVVAETGFAAAFAVVSSLDGGEREPLDPETVLDLGSRALGASVTTALGVLLVRHQERDQTAGPRVGTVDLGLQVGTDRGVAVLTTRF